MKNLLIKQYKTKPKAEKIIDALLKRLEAIFDDSIKTGDILNIDEAENFCLDLVGWHVGQDRNLVDAVKKEFFGFLEHEGLAFDKGRFWRLNSKIYDDFKLDDNDFRTLIRLKIAKNYQTATLENLTEKIRFVFGGDERVFIWDNLDMSLNLTLPAEKISSLLLNYILKNDLLPRPIGVFWKRIMLLPKKPFGFRNNPKNYGFNVGAFAQKFRKEF